MEEDKKTTVSVIPDIITPASNALQANVPETMKQADGALSSIVGLFNNVVLYPVKKANITFKYKLEAFEDDLKQKMKSVPKENIQPPSTMIAGPTLEALRYAYDEKELREMYENLLASAMDNRKSPKAHPAFVDAIKQMSPLDAEVLNKLVDLRQVKCATITFNIKGTTQIYSNGMPNYFIAELYGLADPFLLSASLENLNRLALIKITDYGLSGIDYNAMMTHIYVKDREKLFRDNVKEDFEINLAERAVQITNYGEQFAEVCLGK